MSETETATKIIDALKAAERGPAQVAQPILNGLAGFIQADEEQPLEVEEARSGTFLAICEIGKALHRGTPVEHLWGRRSTPRNGGGRSQDRADPDFLETARYAGG